MSLQSSGASGAAKPIYAGPLYVQLIARLRDRIRHEDWRAGMVIPSESDLAREYQVSVGTARKALEGLENDGWIVRKQGRGTFVNDLASMQMERLCRFRIRGEGPGFDGCVVTTLRSERREATADEASHLSLSRDGGNEVIEVRRRYFKNGSASVLETAILPAGLFAGLETIKRSPVNLFSLVVDEFSIVPHRSSEVVTAVVADDEIADAMQITSGAPLLRSQSTIWDIDGIRIMRLTRYAHASGLDYHVELS